MNRTPVKTSREVSGKNVVTVEFYEENNRYTFGIKAIFGNRAWAKWPKKDDPSYEDLNTARRMAEKALKDWCDKNQLHKAFTATISCFQPELFDDIEGKA